MAEMEYIKYSDFVESLSTTENPDFTDKEVVSNETNGPRSVPANARALANEMSEGKIKVFGANGAGYFDIEKILNNFAGKFVPNVTNAVAGCFYLYNGIFYEARVDYTGDWDLTKFVKVDVGSKLVKKSHINLFDKTTVTANRYLANGVPSYIDGFFTSDWIKVKPGALLKVFSSFITALYDGNKTFVQNNTGIETIIPSGVEYIRVCNRNEFLDSMQVGYTISYDNYKSHNAEQVEDFIDARKVLNIPSIRRQSLINLTNAQYGKYLANDGSVNSSGPFVLTSPVSVKEGYFSSKNLFNYGLYDENRQLTRVVYSPNTVITSSEKYIRFSINTANLYRVQVNLGIGTPTLKTDDECYFDEKGSSTNSYESYDVAVGPSGCNFTTISAALAAITDASPKKRYRIIVAEGTYEDTFSTKDYVDIVGTNRYKCIVNYTNEDVEHYADYSTIFATSNSTLENLTITTTSAKYPVHSDGAFGRNYKLVIKDCTLVHNGFVGGPNGGTALGIGLNHGQHIEVINCRLKPFGTGGAACYCHNSNASRADYSAFRSLKLDGVIFDGGSYGLRLQSLGTDSSFAQKNECVIKNIVSSAAIKDIYYQPGSLDEWVIENFTDFVVEN